MRFLYTNLFRIAIPFILLRLIWRSRKLPAYRHRWKERFAWFQSPNKPDGIWIHAVSFGESMIAILLIKQLQILYPEKLITVTNMTPTGSEKIRATFGDRVFNMYVPYDLPGIMRRFICKVQPQLAIIIETELWPNMLFALKKAGIKTLLANGRLSERSAARYKRIQALTKKMLQCFTKVLVQTKEEAERYIALGCPEEKIVITGNIKFDTSIPESIHAAAEVLKKQLGEERDIFIAASTHEGEEHLILKAFEHIRRDIPDLLLVLVPRHPDRFNKVEKLCRDQSWSVIRRSTHESCTPETDIFLGDTMGELLLFYAVSDVVFVGGSFIPTGGHNVLEPAMFAKAIIVGPHMENFLKINFMLKEAQGICQVTDVEELSKKIIELLQLPEMRRAMGVNAEKVVSENKGALKKHLHVISELV